MNHERIQILKMLQEGKITVDEAARLIAALELPGEKSEPPAPLTAPAAPQPVATPLAVENLAGANKSPLAVHKTVDPWPLKYTLFSNLEGARLDAGNFAGVHIWFSNLDHADLSEADVQDAWIVASNLDGANFAGANLRGAKLLGVNLDGADFGGADLQDAVLIAANFDRANFRGADLRGKHFIGVNMDGHTMRQKTIDLSVEG
jgi:uncharacterized protein YjbI with pentapeptide repeats